MDKNNPPRPDDKLPDCKAALEILYPIPGGPQTQFNFEDCLRRLVENPDALAALGLVTLNDVYGLFDAGLIPSLNNFEWNNLEELKKEVIRLHKGWSKQIETTATYIEEKSCIKAANAELQKKLDEANGALEHNDKCSERDWDKLDALEKENAELREARSLLAEVIKEALEEKWVDAHTAAESFLERTKEAGK